MTVHSSDITHPDELSNADQFDDETPGVSRYASALANSPSSSPLAVSDIAQTTTCPANPLGALFHSFAVMNLVRDIKAVMKRYERGQCETGYNKRMGSRSWDLDDLYNLDYPAKVVTLASQGPFRPESFWHWKEIHAKLRSIDEMIREKELGCIENWNRAERNDHVAVLYYVLHESRKICERLNKEDAEHIVDIEYLLRWIRFAEFAPHVEMEVVRDSDVLVLFLLDCTLCLYCMVEELDNDRSVSNPSLNSWQDGQRFVPPSFFSRNRNDFMETSARYSGGKRYMPSILKFFKEVENSIFDGRLAELEYDTCGGLGLLLTRTALSSMLELKGHLFDVVSFLGIHDVVLQGGLPEKGSIHAYRLFECDNGVVKVQCTPWESVVEEGSQSEKRTATWDLDDFIGFEDGELVGGKSGFSKHVEVVGFDEREIEVKTPTGSSMTFSLSNRLVNFDGDLYAAPFNRILNLDEKRLKKYGVSGYCVKDYFDTIKQLDSTLNEQGD